MRKFLLLVGLVAVTLAGCGGGDGGSTDTASDTASASAGGSGDSDDKEFTGKGSGDFCDLARDYADKFEDAGEADTEAELADDYKKFSDAIDELAAEAPKEIEGDVEVVQDAFAELNGLLEKYDYDFAKIPEEEAATIDLDNPEIEAANNRIESYFETVCKIDTDDDGDTDGKIEDDSVVEGEEQAPAEGVDSDSTDDTTADTAGE